MPQESLTAQYGTPAVLNQSDGGQAYVLATRVTSSSDGFLDANEWWRPTSGPSITCTMTCHRVSDQVLLASKDFNGGLGTGVVQVAYDAPVAIQAGVTYAFGVRTNRYTYTAPGAFPFSNSLHLSASGGSFEFATGGVVFPGQVSTTLYFVSPVITINAVGRVSIFLGKVRNLRPRFERHPVFIFSKQLPPPPPLVPVSYRFINLSWKWRFEMLQARASTLTLNRLRVGVQVDSQGLLYDPSASTVKMAFMTTPLAEPEAGDWKDATWDVSVTGNPVAECLVGPDGAVELAKGEYYQWIKVDDSAAGEIPVEQLGKLVMT